MNPVYFKGGKPVDLVKNGDGETIYGRNFLSLNGIEQGTLGSTTGIPGSSTIRIRTKDFIDLLEKPEWFINIKSDFQYMIFYFDDQKKHVLDVNWSSVATQLNIPDKARFVRVLIAKKNNANILHSELLDSAAKLEIGSTATIWTPAPEDIIGTTATTSQGGDFS